MITIKLYMVILGVIYIYLSYQAYITYTKKPYYIGDDFRSNCTIAWAFFTIIIIGIIFLNNIKSIIHLLNYQIHP